jgi:hypothetical protein
MSSIGSQVGQTLAAIVAPSSPAEAGDPVFHEGAVATLRP